MSNTLPPDITDFVAELKRQQKAPNTIRSYQSDLNRFAHWLTQTDGIPFSAQAIGTEEIAEYSSHLYRNGLRAATINRRLATIRTFCAWALATNRIDDRVSPAADIQWYPTQPSPPQQLDKRELRALKRAARMHGSIRDVAIIQLLYNTGVRASEAAAIRLGDLTMPERGDGELRIRGKGRRQRTAILNLDAKRGLRAYLEVRPVVVADQLFISRLSRPMSAEAILDVVKKYARLAGLEDVTTHTLRHTFAYNLLEASGNNLGLVSGELGHASVVTTQIYTRPTQQDRSQAVNRLSAIQAVIEDFT